jgi:pimeloyl-ACP methyl ester carboxylesterase
MVRKAVRAGLAVAALGASALAADYVLAGRKRLREWETLSCGDADDGGFVTLSDGAQMHYLARGESGDPVILIHGLMSSAHEWRKNIDALAQAHRVYAIDLVGFGFSSRVSGPCYSLRYFAQTVREFMEAQGLARASLVGHSLGGAVALQFAYDYPARTDRLVLLAPGIYLVKYVEPVRYAARVPYLPRTLMSLVVCNPRAQRVSLRNALGHAGHIDEETLSFRVRATRVRGTVDALLAMATSPHASDMRLRVGDIQAPALVIWGDGDLVVPLRHGKRLVRELPHAELVILERAGHLPNEQFPETVNRAMTDFLGPHSIVPRARSSE